MAGIVPTKMRSTGRKQWTLHDGPRGSLRRLRNQLANDGCAESQFVLAKGLLEEECELEADRKENEKQGVYWLIKASEQGNNEATDMLSTCLITGRGITDHNYLDVKSCIKMSQDEKMARKAAREMFASLSNGEDFITSEQLQKRMLQIRSESNSDESSDLADFDSEDEISDWSNRSDAKTEKLTEEHLVAAAVDYSMGHLPLVTRVLALIEPNLDALDHVPYLQRSVEHPVLVMQILYWKLVRWFGRQGGCSWRWRSDLWVMLILGYLAATSNNLALFVSTGLFYGSLLVMVISTFQVIQTRRDFQNFRSWGQLFLTYSGGTLNPEQSEALFLRNNLKPYGHFFLALLLHLLIYPFISDRWMPQSEITVISFCFTFVTLLNSADFDWLVLLSFAVNVLAKYPYETDPVVGQGWRFLDLKAPTFASFVVGYGIEFCLNFRLVFYIVIPVLLLGLAWRQQFRGTYRHLIPHCVTLAWLQMVVIHSQGATMFGLLRTTLVLVGFVMFLPLVGLTTILLPIFAATKTLVLNDIWFGAILLVAILSAIRFLVRSHLDHYAALVSIALIPLIAFQKWDVTDVSWLFCTCFTIVLFVLWLFRHRAFVQLSAALFAVCLLIDSSVWYVNNEVAQDYAQQSVSWDRYQEHCYPLNWEQGNIAQIQLKCRTFVSAPVNWEGYVNEVKLRSVENPYQYLIDMFPLELSDFFSCYFGEPISDRGSDFRPRKCHLDAANSYHYQLHIRMPSGLWSKSAEVVLMADHAFTNFSTALQPNDKVWFKGVLADGDAGCDGLVGGRKPHVRLTEIGCLVCRDAGLTSAKSHYGRFGVRRALEKLWVGVKFLLNVLFSPVVVFK